MKILVVGDAILDVYLHGDWTRANPEQHGGRVFRVMRREHRLGGAAAVAMLCRSLEPSATVALCCALGGRPGEILRDMVEATGILARGASEAVAQKTRLVVRGEVQRDRIDLDPSYDLGEWHSTCLGEWAGDWRPDVVLVADYGKGVVTPWLIETMHGRLPGGVPVWVDPARERPWSDYPAAWAVKANRDEARVEAGRVTPDTLRLPWPAVVDGLTLTRDGPVVVTRGADGLYARGHYEPAVRVDAAVDVTGAGDTVLAALGVATLRNLPLADALRFAAKAAAVQVAGLGVVPVEEKSF